MLILDRFLARNYTHSENIHTVITFLRGFTCTELGVLCALLRELTESEAIEHVCISKSRYHEVKKHLLKTFDPGQKPVVKKVQKNSFWSLRETDRYDIICGVNGNVYFSAHFKGFILYKSRFLPQFLTVIFSAKHPYTTKSA